MAPGGVLSRSSPATYRKGTLRSPSSLRPSRDAILSILIWAMLEQVQSASPRAQVGG